ncbi:MAG: FtsW/RodA/SpoVE family cell cycle protein, partial [Candidatus Doudnabacteria bacterium]|nr:FtsW/RodA/SpoVE family cell cycle protein [Candidatus Doudnabacteria bacterium]
MTRRLKPRAHFFDVRLAAAAGGLLAIGLIMLYSVSTVESLSRFGITTHFLKNQLLQGLLLGSIGLYICSRIDYHWWQKLIPVVVGAALLLLLLVKFPGIGFSAGGASRWVHVGPIFFQPAELAKLAVVMYCAAWFSARRQHLTDFFSGVLPMLVIVGLFSGLILWQPDFGTMVSLLGTTTVMIIVAGTPWRWIGSLATVGVAVLFLLIKFEPYRAARLLTFLNPGL